MAVRIFPASASAGHRDGHEYVRPGNLVVSGSVWDVSGVDLVPGVTAQPPGRPQDYSSPNLLISSNSASVS